jgi:hypothetical protein
MSAENRSYRNIEMKMKRRKWQRRRSIACSVETWRRGGGESSGENGETRRGAVRSFMARQQATAIGGSESSGSVASRKAKISAGNSETAIAGGRGRKAGGWQNLGGEMALRKRQNSAYSL